MSRKITGEYTLTIDDIKKQRVFIDNIATAPFSPSSPDFYQIPYRCLVPKRINNLLIAGRCISTDLEAHDVTREIGPCMAVGQAAGTAAALSVEKGFIREHPFSMSHEIGFNDALQLKGASVICL